MTTQRSPRRRLGRRPAGGKSTRDDILRATARLISRRGFRGVSVRDVARAAKVDPALIYRYFTNKEQLFLAGLRQSFTLIRATPGEEGLDYSGVGERIVFRFLSVWGKPRTSPMVVNLLRAAAENAAAARQFRAYIEQTIIPAVRLELGPAAPRRASLVGSILLGVGVMRYLLRVEPLASMSDGEIAELAGPLVTSVLSGLAGNRGMTLAQGRGPTGTRQNPNFGA